MSLAAAASDLCFLTKKLESAALASICRGYADAFGVAMAFAQPMQTGRHMAPLSSQNRVMKTLWY